MPLSRPQTLVTSNDGKRDEAKTSSDSQDELRHVVPRCEGYFPATHFKRDSTAAQSVGQYCDEVGSDLRECDKCLLKRLGVPIMFVTR
jgi:hypothetical protein